MGRFEGRLGDHVWGPSEFKVTAAQKKTLDGLKHLFAGIYISDDLSYKQLADNGDVIVKIDRNSVTVKRSGRMHPNRR